MVARIKNTYANTKLELYERFKNVDGVIYYQIKNYDDARIKNDTVAKHLAENRLSVSWSGGKDSTIATEYLFLEGKNPLVVLCDMGYEFDETYSYIKSIIKRWQKLYGATVVVLDTQYFFLDRIFTRNIKGYKKGLVRGFPITLGKAFCTRDGKIRPSNYFIETNSPLKDGKNYGDEKEKIEIIESSSFTQLSMFDTAEENKKYKTVSNYKTVDVAVGYAYDESRSVENWENLNFIYPLKEKRIIESDVLALTKEWNIFNSYYDLYFRGGVYRLS